MTSNKMWMARGDGGRLYDAFQERGIIAIGWSELIDAQPGMSRKELAEIYARVRPDLKQGTIISGASQVWRFINEIAIEDFCITYDPTARKYAVGKIAGDCVAKLDPQDRGVALLRKVKWLGEIDRDELSTHTKNSLGSTLTVFQVPSSSTNEVLAVLKRGPAKTPMLESTVITDEVEDEEEVRDTRDLLEETEARAIEFIKDRVSKLDWSEMQELIAGILRAMGYKTRVARPGPDRGADIVASPDGLGFEMPRIVVEVKHRDGSMGAKEIRSFLGGRHKDDRGLYVNTGGFSKDARYEADRASIPVTLWDLDDLVRYLVENYDQLDSDTKQLVPLKRVYWPA